MGQNVRDDRVSRKKARIKAMLHLAAEDAKAAKLLAQAGNHYAAYHCQQASEKLIRSLLIYHDIEPGLDHHLDILVGKLPESEPWRETLEPLHKYTPYATTFRYATPGGRVPPAPEASKIGLEAEQIASLITAARKELVGEES